MRAVFFNIHGFRLEREEEADDDGNLRRAIRMSFATQPMAKKGVKVGYSETTFYLHDIIRNTAIYLESGHLSEEAAKAIPLLSAEATAHRKLARKATSTRRKIMLDDD